VNPSSPYHLILSLLGLGMAAASQLHAQTSGRREIFAGSELETYIRLLQIDGKAALYPWFIRSFSPKEIDRFLAQPSDHPWAEHYDLGQVIAVAFSITLCPALKIFAMVPSTRLRTDSPSSCPVDHQDHRRN